MKLEVKYQSELNHKETKYTKGTTRLKEIDRLSFPLLKHETFPIKAHCIICLARNYHNHRFYTKQASDIKSALNQFGDDRQSLRTARNFLYLSPTKITNLTIESKLE